MSAANKVFKEFKVVSYQQGASLATEVAKASSGWIDAEQIIAVVPNHYGIEGVARFLLSGGQAVDVLGCEEDVVASIVRDLA